MKTFHPAVCHFHLHTVELRQSSLLNTHCVQPSDLETIPSMFPPCGPFPLIAETEGADTAGYLAIRFVLGSVHCAETGLSILAPFTQQEDIGQVGDIAGCQAQCLYLGELPIHWFGGYKGTQSSESRVHTLGPVSFSGVCGLSLLDHHNLSRFPWHLPSLCRTVVAA